MSFWHDVYKLREQGLLPRVWTRAHLHPLLKAEYPNALVSLPSWHTVSEDGTMMGYFVRAGLLPEAWNLGGGAFRLVVDPDDDAETQRTERQRAIDVAKAARPRFKNKVAENAADGRFWDDVYKLRQQDAIPRDWNAAGLLPFLQGSYGKIAITSYPDGYSLAKDGEEAGYSVKRGLEPRAWRVGSGEYRLVVDPSDDDTTQQAERRRAIAGGELAVARELANPHSFLLPESCDSDSLFEPIYIAVADFQI